MGSDIPGFYVGVGGETYYRSPYGISYHYWFVEGPRGDEVEYDEAAVPSDAKSVFPDDSHAVAVATWIDEYEAEERAFRERHGEPEPRSRS